MLRRAQAPFEVWGKPAVAADTPVTFEGQRVEVVWPVTRRRT